MESLPSSSLYRFTCIVQDNELEWEFEAGRMNDVYEGGYINIAAMDAENADGGCFLDSPNPPAVAPIDNGISKQRAEFYVPAASGREVAESSLLDRGWVQQEVTLARQVLYCGKSQWFWRCK
jgi:hypothetical protein